MMALCFGRAHFCICICTTALMLKRLPFRDKILNTNDGGEMEYRKNAEN